MRRVLAASLAAVAVAATTPPAHAAPVVAGTTCGFLAVEHDLIVRQEGTGVLFGAVAAVDTDPLANPVPVSITCTLKFDGVVRDTVTSVVDNGVAVALGLVGYEALPGDDVDVCTRIDPGMPTECVDTTLSLVPPQEVCDPVPALCALTGQATFRYAIPQPVLR